jgi:protein-S-isoprenylcysteine O-methyltransferase Ste14
VLFFRALLAFLALPTFFGGIVPWWLRQTESTHGSGTALGWPVMILGLTILLMCVRDFYRIGKGTLAPWDPPKKLVIVGLYRYVRNPMYIGLLSWVAGWSLMSGSWRMGIYVIILFIMFHLRVISYEEPALARLFPADWAEYRFTVNRWVPSQAARSRRS